MYNANLWEMRGQSRTTVDLERGSGGSDYGISLFTIGLRTINPTKGTQYKDIGGSIKFSIAAGGQAPVLISSKNDSGCPNGRCQVVTVSTRRCAQRSYRPRISDLSSRGDV